MHIQITKKIIDWLKPTLIEKDTDNDLFAFHANFVTLNRRKFLVIMNDITRYCFVFWGVQKKDLEVLSQWIYWSMRNVLSDDFSKEEVDKFIDSMPKEITYGKTKNPQLIARLNRSMLDAEGIAYSMGLNFDYLDQMHISKTLNDFPVGENNWKVTYIPKEKMKEYIGMLD